MAINAGLERTAHQQVTELREQAREELRYQANLRRAVWVSGTATALIWGVAVVMFSRAIGFI